MVNYNNSKIYKIINDINGMIYYGSTTQPLVKRMDKHRSNCKNKISKTYEKFGNIKDCKIFLIENYPCNSKEELLARERMYVENNECVNSEVPGRTHAEYYQDNLDIIHKKDRERYKNEKEKRIKNAKEYYEKNKEAINNRRNKKITCDCGGSYCISSKTIHYKTNKHKNYILKL